MSNWNKVESGASPSVAELHEYLSSIPKAELVTWLTAICRSVDKISLGWHTRTNRYIDEICSDQSLPLPMAKVTAALIDYEVTSTMDDDEARFYKKIARLRPPVVGGHVYVIEFSDGNIKIGNSIVPSERVRTIAAGNQATLLRSWVSKKCIGFSKIERDAHRRFARDRVGGEYFKTDFDMAAKWVDAAVKRNLECDDRRSSGGAV